ncbi:M23 family metallopeptidase [Velocimicrobium porci]|uniref:M23 family metallopeptidase n=1 Tax=Velocimicrobium porci TaxID=2606634 RepID=A0A6L5XZJ6_9FIRM|nr:M23 family metallopeptidase [Velocimicrobium porci]MSS64049.1 M23 family metallopeptidase [Velocimicrobium porci]
MKKKHGIISIKIGILAILLIVLGISYLQDAIWLERLDSKESKFAFRALSFNQETIESLRQVKKENPSDWDKKLAFAMIRQDFHFEQKRDLEVRTVPNYYNYSKKFGKLRKSYRELFTDIEYFPVGEDIDGKEHCFYENSWYSERAYGGKRVHEGTDIMTSNNKRGYFPVYSMTDGRIEKKGWLKLGGYRIGVRAPGGGYFYYAHMSEYAPNLEEGDIIKAGQLIGYVGDTGYSEVEGTTGNFDVHLHVGVYLKQAGKEISVNPYWILKYIEDKKVPFHLEGNE